MTKKISPQDNSANMGNANKGTPGTNRQYDQNQGNRGAQLDGNRTSAPLVKPPSAAKGPARGS